MKTIQKNSTRLISCLIVVFAGLSAVSAQNVPTKTQVLQNSNALKLNAIRSAPVKTITLAELKKKKQDDKDKIIKRLRAENLVITANLAKTTAERDAARTDANEWENQAKLEAQNTFIAEQALANAIKAHEERKVELAKEKLGKQFLRENYEEVKKDNIELVRKLKKANGQKKWYAIGGLVGGVVVCSQSRFLN